MVRVGLDWIGLRDFFYSPQRFELVGLAQVNTVQKNEHNSTQNANPTQPNPYSSGWVGPGCRIVGLNVHPYHKPLRTKTKKCGKKIKIKHLKIINMKSTLELI